MSDLVDLALDAHGGIERWSAARTIRAHLSMGGPIWAALGQPDVLADVEVAVDVHEQRTIFTGLTAPGRRGTYTPDRVSLVGSDGTVVAERRDPRWSFPIREASARWDVLHVLYFAGYGLWNYLTTPYLLTSAAVTTRELPPATSGDGLRRRLAVTFGPGIATHSVEQVFSFDSSGLLRHLEYAPFVMGGRRAEHHVHDHRAVDGLVFPTHRRVLALDADGRPDPSPVITLDLANLVIDPLHDADSAPGDKR